MIAGQTYYINKSTGISQWEKPDGPAGRMSTVQCSHILVKHRESRRPSSWRQENITRSKEEALKQLEGNCSSSQKVIVTGKCCMAEGDIFRIHGDVFSCLLSCLLLPVVTFCYAANCITVLRGSLVAKNQRSILVAIFPIFLARDLTDVPPAQRPLPPSLVDHPVRPLCFALHLWLLRTPPLAAVQPDGIINTTSFDPCCPSVVQWVILIW